jgi:tetratricopeptide (TPR) repeat protein
MKTMNRNDPCPCGSGKKYKKCCQSDKPVQLTDIMSAELEAQQQSILYYTLQHYENELDGVLEDFEFPLNEMPEDAVMVLSHYTALWMIFSDLIKQNILEEFLKTHGAKIKRPRAKQIVESWKDGFAALVRVEKQQSSIHYLVSDILTNNEYSITLLNERPFKEQELLFGFFVPYESTYTIFTEVLTFEGEDAINGEQAIIKLYQEVLEEDAESFYNEWFIEILETLLFGSLDEVIEDLEWENEQHQIVAAIFQNMLEEEGAPSSLIRLGVTLWYQYCQIQPPARIQKPQLYVAALHYLVDSFTFPEGSLRKKEYAEEYSISPSSLSSKIRELENVLAEELVSLREAVDFEDMWADFDDEDVVDDEDVDFDFMEDGPFLSGQHQAQELIFKAIQEPNTTKRKKLAKEALTIDPDCADAYVILGEEERDVKKKMDLYEKGLQAGEQALGKKFFKENKGHFWGFHETKPYMRAKFSLAMLLLEMGQTDEAIVHLEELLDLNPNDNQGVRYTLTQAYLKNGLFTKVEELFKQYDVDDAHTAYSRILINYHKRGITKGLEKLLKAARGVNPHVLPYLLKEKRLPKKQPDYVGFGDESEAVSYVFDFGEFWWGEQELMEWVKKLLN